MTKAPLDGDAFFARCDEALAARAPVFIMHLRELPRNANGKIMRNELAALVVQASQAQAAARQKNATLQ